MGVPAAGPAAMLQTIVDRPCWLSLLSDQSSTGASTGHWWVEAQPSHHSEGDEPKMSLYDLISVYGKVLIKSGQFLQKKLFLCSFSPVYLEICKTGFFFKVLCDQSSFFFS